MTTRATVNVEGIQISYLTAGGGGPLVLLLHGTYWSRVWQPVLDDIAAAGLHPVAVDFPGFGRSGGELSVAEGSIPQLAAWLVRFLEAMDKKGPVMLAGHDIGGGVAQHLLISRSVDVLRLALVNAVMYELCGPYPALPASAIRPWQPRRRPRTFLQRVGSPW